MRVTIDLSEFTPIVREKIDLLPLAVERGMVNLAFEVEGQSKRELYPGHGFITGELRRSIRTDTKGSGASMKIKVGPHKIYADKIEDGFGSFPGYFYMHIGAENATRNAQNIFERAFNSIFGG